MRREVEEQAVEIKTGFANTVKIFIVKKKETRSIQEHEMEVKWKVYFACLPLLTAASEWDKIRRKAHIFVPKSLVSRAR